jgi:hypothetical protein
VAITTHLGLDGVAIRTDALLFAVLVELHDRTVRT